MILSATKKLTVSAICIALYCVIMYFTSSFSFLQVQMRFATGMYGLGYLFPFLTLPLGIANFLSNAIGDLGPIDMIGGGVVGVLTTGACALIGKYKFHRMFCLLPIILIPGLGVALWLAPALNIPYLAAAVSLLLGQIVPAVLGVVLCRSLEAVWIKQGLTTRKQM